MLANSLEEFTSDLDHKAACPGMVKTMGVRLIAGAGEQGQRHDLTRLSSIDFREGAPSHEAKLWEFMRMSWDLKP